LSLQARKFVEKLSDSDLPAFNSKEMDCIFCQKKMFYSEENLVHVCLEESHGTLCYFEPDKCWFAAKEETALKLEKKGLKFHFIPKSVFEDANFEFKCNDSTLK
jgi:hypothetical protein